MPERLICIMPASVGVTDGAPMTWVAIPPSFAASWSRRKTTGLMLAPRVMLGPRPTSSCHAEPC